MRGKWFEVNDSNHSATEAPQNIQRQTGSYRHREDPLNIPSRSSATDASQRDRSEEQTVQGETGSNRQREDPTNIRSGGSIFDASPRDRSEEQNIKVETWSNRQREDPPNIRSGGSVFDDRSEGPNIHGGLTLNITLNANNSADNNNVESNKEEDEAGQGPTNKSRSSSDVPQAYNQRSIDEKMPTEETDEVNAVEETTDEKKGRGTKPLPARDEDSHTRAESTQDQIEAKEATYKGPQPVPAAKEESIQTPTKETAVGNTLAMVGIQDITFPKNDIKSNKTKLTEKSEDHNFTQELAALKEA